MDRKAILKNYQEEAEEIISKMVRVLMVSQRKVDDEKYRKTLESLNKT
jgi:hypothetical protein